MLDQERMPRHVAIIMDGNGRWAKNRGLPRLAGHNAGMKAMKKIVDHSDKLGIRYLTVYAFSTENWKRSLAEVSGIFKLLVTYVNSDLKGLIENNVKVQVLGDYSTLPKDAVKSLEKTLEETKNNTGEERLSNFLLWQSAYSELVFADALWPDFTPEEYEKAIEEYQSRDRRFGGR